VTAVSSRNRTWLLCDYGEVLSLPQPERDRRAIEEAAGLSGDSGMFWAAYWDHRPDYDRAKMTPAEYWLAVTGREADHDQLEWLVATDTASWMHPNLASVAAVERLTARDISAALFSNAPVEVAAGIAAAPWLRSFSRKFFSCDLGVAKPEPAAYEAVLDALGVTADGVLFVDDRPANIAGAQAVGIRAVLFERPSQLDELF
jgi:putative hydrolase of the HAD superfamily